MEHPILFLDLLTGAFNLHIPPHVTYTWFIMALLVGLGLLASRSISLVPAGRPERLRADPGRPGRIHGGHHRRRRPRLLPVHRHPFPVYLDLQPYRAASGVFVPHLQYQYAAGHGFVHLYFTHYLGDQVPRRQVHQAFSGAHPGPGAAVLPHRDHRPLRPGPLPDFASLRQYHG